jgi:hypothetical protein
VILGLEVGGAVEFSWGLQRTAVGRRHQAVSYDILKLRKFERTWNSLQGLLKRIASLVLRLIHAHEDVDNYLDGATDLIHQGHLLLGGRASDYSSRQVLCKSSEGGVEGVELVVADGDEKRGGDLLQLLKERHIVKKFWLAAGATTSFETMRSRAADEREKGVNVNT